MNFQKWKKIYITSNIFSLKFMKVYSDAILKNYLKFHKNILAKINYSSVVFVKVYKLNITYKNSQLALLNSVELHSGTVKLKNNFLKIKLCLK